MTRSVASLLFLVITLCVVAFSSASTLRGGKDEEAKAKPQFGDLPSASSVSDSTAEHHGRHLYSYPTPPDVPTPTFGGSIDNETSGCWTAGIVNSPMTLLESYVQLILVLSLFPSTNSPPPNYSY